jgi:hypothetical protein
MLNRIDFNITTSHRTVIKKKIHICVNTIVSYLLLSPCIYFLIFLHFFLFLSSVLICTLVDYRPVVSIFSYQRGIPYKVLYTCDPTPVLSGLVYTICQDKSIRPLRKGGGLHTGYIYY